MENLGKIAKIGESMNEWKKMKFDDIIDMVSSKIETKKLRKEQYISTENMNVNFGGIDVAKELPNIDKCNSFMKGDILFSNIRTYFKKVWLSEFSGGCSADVIIFRSKNENVLLNDYLYFLICSEQFINFTVVSSKGTKMPRGDKTAMKNYIFDIPNIDYQRDCVERLKSLNQKIQLNTQINQTLEQIAQTIFKSWFIDFDPIHAKITAKENGENPTLAAMQEISGKNADELHRLQTENPQEYRELEKLANAFPSEIGEDGVPKGWEYKSTKELFDVGIGKTPPRKESHWFSNNFDDVQWISIKDMGNSGVFIIDSSEYLLQEAVDKFNVKVIPENTVILSFKLTVGRVGITTCKTTTNEAIAHFKNVKRMLPTEFLYCYLKDYDFMKMGSTSSIATAVNSKMIKEMLVLTPPKDIVNVFEHRVKNLFAMIKNVSLSNSNLEKIRDELLPRLLKGEF